MFNNIPSTPWLLAPVHRSKAFLVIRARVPLPRGWRPAFAHLHELAEFATGTGAVSEKIFMGNMMRGLSTTPCRGIARQVLASSPLRARLDGRPILPGRPVPSNGLQ